MKRGTGALRSVLLTWVGLLASWGCADFQKEETTYCQNNPTICGEELIAVRQVSSREQHTLAVGTDGRVWAWGQNTTAQLGDGTVTDRTRPTKLQGLSGIEAVSAGYGHSLARGGGKVWRWGQIGSGPRRMTPEEVPGLDDVTAIAAGNIHSLVRHQSGAVSFWGIDGANQEIDTPTGVTGLPYVEAIAAGGAHSLALDANGDVWAWGDNSKFQLGRDDVEVSLMPRKVLGLTKIKAIAAGFNHSLALDAENKVWAWGDNTEGQLGDGSKGNARASPKQIDQLENIEELAAGPSHSLARNRNNELMAWGQNSAGQLGIIDLSTEEQLTPGKVALLTNAKAIAAGRSRSLAVLSNGCLYAWGSNQDGRLGVDERVIEKLVSLPPNLRVEGIIPIPAPISISCELLSGGL
ncbi:RCC1 domain-containing protein [Stigmatella hybrida]|uniref:RCC1 domain-containing protein n=1 Tax=Stigmatella hybrida TaxID=394097 RepID=UPI001CDB43F3|nr:sialidase [Stigmatella hybrida]